MSRAPVLFTRAKTVIGVIHLPPLPGYEASPGLPAVIGRALADLEVLAAVGVDGVLVENEDDHPHRVEAAAETIAAMALVARALVQAAGSLPIGVEILLNDARASLAVAAMAGASFIRTDYFVDRMERPGYGVMAVDPEGLMAYRARLSAGQVLVLADVQVKYARMLEPRPLAESAADAAARRADAVVVTGPSTGAAPTPAEVREAKNGAGHVPVLVGSGATPENVASLMAAADGVIVGSSLKRNGRIDERKAAAFVAAVRAVPPA